MSHDALTYLAHEFKTPLVTVRQACALLADGVGGEVTEEQQRLVEIICKGIASLEGMTCEFLQAAQAASGELDLHFQTVDLATVVADRCDRLAVNAEVAEALLEVSVSPRLAPLWGDGDKLGHVVENLMTNALRVTPPGGQVVVRVTGDGERQTVRVRDQGPGIAEDERSRIFLPFVRGHSGSGKGHGLGLHLCDVVIRRHQGRIWIEQPPEGGSEFCFELPVDRRRGVRGKVEGMERMEVG